MLESQYSAVAHVLNNIIYIEHSPGFCENIVSGKILTSAKKVFMDQAVSSYKPEVKFNDLVNILRKLKTYYSNPKEVEMTFDGEKWWVLQTKDLK